MTSRNGKAPSTIVAGRLARCRKAMKKDRIEAFLVSKPSDGRYLTGFTGDDSALLITPKDVHVITDGRFDESVNQECPWATKWLRKGTLDQEIAGVCQKLKIRSLAVQPDVVTLASVAAWKKSNRATRIVDAPSIVTKLRRVKDAQELQCIRKAVRIAEDAFRAVRLTIRVGETELELAARLEFEMKRRGAQGLSFPSIVAEGVNAALPHAHPGQRRVKKGSAILFDWGARVNGYCSDLTRVVFVSSIPERIGEIYRITLAAQRLAIAAIRPGKRLCDVDAVAREHIRVAGFGEAFNHGLGHGLGLDVHESPRLSWQSTDTIEEGSVVTVEPGIYLPGVGGVRIEDDVLVTGRGARVLSRLEKSLESCII